MSIKNFAAGVGVALALLAGPVSAATIVGEKVQVDYIFPTKDKVGSAGGGAGMFVVGDDAETNLGGILDIDISDNLLTLTATRDYDISDREFQGIRIWDKLGAFDSFTSFSLRESSFLNVADLTFDAESLWVNLTGSSNARAGDVLSAKFEMAPAPVPLPAAGLLLVAGIGALGATRRFSKKRVAA